MEIFVGNLSFSATRDDLKKLFENFGDVSSATIISEKNTTKSRGFGFVKMPDSQQALAAIESLNGKEFIDRPLNVARAQSKPKPPRAAAKQDTLMQNTPVEHISYQKQAPHRISLPAASRRVSNIPKVTPDKARPYNKPQGTKKSGSPFTAGRDFIAAANPTFIKPGGRRMKSQGRRRSWDGRGPSGKYTGAAAPHKEYRKFDYRRKAEGQRNSWEKTENKREGSKPWPREKTGGGFKPWGKDRDETRPWKKPGHKSRPWERPAEKQDFGKRGKDKPKTWGKTGGRPRKSFAKGYRKSGGDKPKRQEGR